MTREQLEEIRDLCKELEYIKKQIESAGNALPVATDSVRGSSPHFPYCEHSIIIADIDPKAFDKMAGQLRDQMRSRVDEISRKINEANAYIMTLPDADTRIILQCRYIRRMTWEQIESDVGIPHATAQRKHRKWENEVM